MQAMKAIEASSRMRRDGQISLTDPDARSMKTRGNGIVGYNVQTAVDASITSSSNTRYQRGS